MLGRLVRVISLKYAKNSFSTLFGSNVRFIKAANLWLVSMLAHCPTGWPRNCIQINNIITQLSWIYNGIDFSGEIYRFSSTMVCCGTRFWFSNICLISFILSDGRSMWFCSFRHFQNYSILVHVYHSAPLLPRVLPHRHRCHSKMSTVHSSSGRWPDSYLFYRLRGLCQLCIQHLLEDLLRNHMPNIFNRFTTFYRY